MKDQEEMIMGRFLSIFTSGQSKTKEAVKKVFASR